MSVAADRQVVGASGCGNWTRADGLCDRADARRRVPNRGGLAAVELIASSAKLMRTFQTQLDSCITVHLAVAWASVSFPEYHALVAAGQEIGRAVIGTHFYQTAPEFIEQFANDKRVRFALDHSGVFHPKLYLFEHAHGGWSCIVGSANFTAGGFGRNQEACLLVTEADDPNGAIWAKALQSIKGYWKDAKPGTSIDLDRYRAMRERLAQSLTHAAGQFGAGKPGRPIEEIAAINLSRDEFFNLVREGSHHSLERRLNVLGAARSLFETGQFNAMEREDRQRIAGFREDNDMTWGWFGFMGGAGVFTKIVNENPNPLSDALDQVPLNGQVTREDYLAFVDRYMRAFPLHPKSGEPTRHGLGTATRLLAMKRPDYFVCLDRANRPHLLPDFGVTLPTHDYEGDWD